MKYIKKYEDYEYNHYEQLNEGLIKSILLFPFNLLGSILGLTFLQFAPRVLKKQIFENVLDVYSNIETLKLTLNKLLNEGDVTDTERKKIEKHIKYLDKIKRKYPSLSEYKIYCSKNFPWLNIKNRNYIKNAIMTYEPKEMTITEIAEKIRKIYKDFYINNSNKVVRGELASSEPEFNLE